mmetsp:Transcript_18710/g.42722  ORF Transcript_18710/g.42722 Transcript_18710/m.42722 type:complete len:81 (-) Transcript_18710:2771-3013(-)
MLTKNILIFYHFIALELEHIMYAKRSNVGNISNNQLKENKNSISRYTKRHILPGRYSFSLRYNRLMKNPTGEAIFPSYIS